MPTNLENSAVATGLEKVSFQGHFSFQYQRKVMPPNIQTTAQLHTFHMPGKNNAQNP